MKVFVRKKSKGSLKVKSKKIINIFFYKNVQ